MKFAVSSIEKPFAFFDDYIRKGGINIHLNEYVEEWIMLEKSNPSRYKVILMDYECIVHETYSTYQIPEDGSYNDNAEFDEVNTYSFAQTSEKQLELEILKSKELIKEINQDFINKFNDSSKILSFHAKSLEELIEESGDVFAKFPNCIDYLNSLKEYVQDLSIKGSTIFKEFNLKSENTKSDEETEVIFDPIDEILGYLKGYNEHHQKIMHETDYDTLIELIGKVVNNEEVIIDKKLVIEVPVMVLRYTFYVLHLHLFGNEKNESFIQFLLNTILKFEKWDLKPFKAKISEPPSKFPTYIPQIILDQRQKQR